MCPVRSATCVLGCSFTHIGLVNKPKPRRRDFGPGTPAKSPAKPNFRTEFVASRLQLQSGQIFPRGWKQRDTNT